MAYSVNMLNGFFLYYPKWCVSGGMSSFVSCLKADLLVDQYDLLSRWISATLSYAGCWLVSALYLFPRLINRLLHICCPWSPLLVTAYSSYILLPGFYFLPAVILPSNFSPASKPFVLGIDSCSGNMSCYLMLSNSQWLWYSKEILHERPGKQNRCVNLLIALWC